jgi:uncharacterized damage-inducible protein DinB
MADAMASFRDGLKTILSEHHRDMRSIVDGLDVEAINWTPGPETNSIAVLITHSLGAEHSLLSTALGQPIDRDRDAEFRVQPSSAAELVQLIDRMDDAAPGLIDRLSAEDLAAERSRPNDRLGRVQRGIWWLLHAVEHNREHIGQAMLTRQLYEQQRGS